MKKTLLLFFLILSFQYIYSQSLENKIDSIDVLLSQKQDEKTNYILTFEKIELLIDNKNLSEAKKLCNSILDKLSPKKDPNLTAKSYYFIGLIYKDENKYDLALNNFYEALSLEEQITENRIIVDIYFEIGYVYMLIGNLEKAILFLKKSNEDLEDLGNEVEKAKTINNIGYMYEVSGKYDLALKYYREALAVFEKFEDKQSVSFVLNNIGALFREIENYEMAIDYYTKALKIKKELKDTASMSTTYNNFGVVYQKQEKYDKAIEFYNKALEISKNNNDIKSIARTTNNIGKVYESQQKYEQALELYFKSLKLKDSINDNHGKILSYLNIGKVYKKTHDYNKSIEYLTQGLKLADSLSYVKELSAIYKEISEVYEMSNNLELALKFHKKYSIINDTILNKEKQKNINELEISYQTSEKEKQLIYLKKENESKEKILFRNGYLTVTIIFLLIFISLFFYILNNRKKLRIINKSVVLEQKLLRSQMNPHFIFNSLSSIQAYIYSNETMEAGKYIANFAKLMRLILENSRKEFISVSNEIETLEYYLKLQKLRFDNKFDYKVIISENINSENDYIPPMLAQPIIENAIEHGVRKLDRQGSIEINFVKKGKSITLSVTDNGRGFDENKSNQKEKNESYALKITEERLATYSKNSKIKIKTLKKQDKIVGTKVSFQIPLKI